MKSRALAALASTAAAALALLPTIGHAMAPNPAQMSPEWHVFVYIVNDSEGQLPYGQDIDEMVTASRASGISFTVYLDSSDVAGPALSTTLVPNTGDALVIEIAGGAITVTQRLGELDSGEPDTLAWFLAQGLLTHPSERNALVVWDHGAGWYGIGFDEDVSATGSRRGSSLDSTDIAAALDRGLAAAGRDQLDLIVFDACLMASLDSLGAVSGRADYMIASEEVIPGLGLDYEAFSVLAQPGVTPSAYFDAISNAYVTEVADAQPSEAQAYTLSMFDVNQTQNITSALGAFVTAAVADVRINPQPYIAATSNLWHYGVSGDFWFGFVDIGEYLNRLTGVGAAATAARDQVLAALAAARVGQRNGTPTFDSATGLTVYFPLEPREFDARFEHLATAPLWMPFLSAFLDAQAGVIVQTDVGFVSETMAVAPATDDPRFYQLSVPVTANFTGTVELVAATTAADGTRTYFESDSGSVDNGVASAYIYPTLTTISDGLRSVVPFTRYVAESDGMHGYSTFTLRRANGSVAQLNWARPSGPFTVVDGNGVVTSYTAQAGDLAYPINLVQQAGGVPVGVASDSPLDPNRGWTVTDDPIPDGTPVYVELRLLDVNGVILDTVAGTLVAGQ